jgi:hypothetical protein
MKFRCNRLTYDRRKWHRVFAFLPQLLPDGTFVWLEVVERRAPLHLTLTPPILWEYRLPQA